MLFTPAATAISSLCPLMLAFWSIVLVASSLLQKVTAAAPPTKPIAATAAAEPEDNDTPLSRVLVVASYEDLAENAKALVGVACEYDDGDDSTIFVDEDEDEDEYDERRKASDRGLLLAPAAAAAIVDCSPWRSADDAMDCSTSRPALRGLFILPGFIQRCRQG